MEKVAEGDIHEGTDRGVVDFADSVLLALDHVSVRDRRAVRRSALSFANGERAPSHLLLLDDPYPEGANGVRDSGDTRDTSLFAVRVTPRLCMVARRRRDSGGHMHVVVEDLVTVGALGLFADAS